eukprot:XP_001689763.1 hypothetical protein CHLREDRAFT_195864 [Chlamydomonas reinhardtii]
MQRRARGLLAQPTVPPAPATPAPLTRPASGRLGSVGGGAGAAGAEVVTTVALQAPEGSWGEVALLHSSQPQRSTRTVVAGPTGCVTLQLRHTDYDALCDPRAAMMLLPSEGQVGPPAVVELSMTQRRAATHALLCCAVRRLASARPPAARTAEDVSELQPLLGCLPPYRAYAPELLAAMAGHGSVMRLPAGSMVYEAGTLADTQVTVLSGEVELRRFGASGVEDSEVDGGGVPGSRLSGPAPPPAEDESNSIRARLKKERDARKALQARLDDYVGRMQGETGDNTGETAAGKAAAVAAAAKAAAASNHVDWTRMFMQKGYTDNEGMGAAGGVGRGSESGGPGGAASGAGAGGGGGEGSVRAVRAARWGFSVDGPESESEKKLRHMAMRASRIQRDRASRSQPGAYSAADMEEAYGGLLGTVGPGSCAGELSTHTLHSAMRQENAVAGPSGCEVMLVDWDAYQQGVLNARAGALTRSAVFLADLPPGRLLQLAELCLVLSVAPGTLLAKQAAPLESMVVVQSGELLLLHELPATHRSPKPHTLTASAVSRTRNGRIHTLPLLSTLNQTVLPTAAAAKDATAAALSGPAPPGASPAPPAPPPALGSPAGSAPSSAGGNNAGGNMSEVTLHGLPLGELGVSSIVGEGILGIKEKERERERQGSRAGDGTASASGSGSGGADGAASAPGGAGALDAHAPHPPPGGPSPPPQPPGGGAAGSAAAGDGGAPKWSATVLASKPSVLLVIQKSVLYMAEFDFLRGELQKYAAERQAWVGKRVEAAYRDAAAHGSVPAVFSTSASPAPPLAASPAPPPGSGLSSPSLRRSMFAATTNAAIAAAYISSTITVSSGGNITGGGAGSGGGGGGILGQLAEAGATNDLVRGITGDIMGPSAGGGATDNGLDSGFRPGTASPMRTPSISGHRGSVDGGPPSANVLGRSGSLTGAGHSSTGPPGSGLFSRSGSGHRVAPSSPAASKWDFLDGPGSATAAEVAGAGGSVAAEPSAGTLGRGGGGGPGAPSRANSLQRSSNMKTGGGGGGGGRGDTSVLTPVQLALQEAGLDPGLASDGGPGGMVLGGGGGGGGRDGSGSGATPPRRNAAPVPAPGVLSAMPQLIATNSPLASPRVRTLQSLRTSHSGMPGSFGTGSSGGSPSLSASHDFDSVRASSGAGGGAAGGGGGGAGVGGSGANSPAFRSGALTPAGRRSFSGHPAGVPPSLASSLLDNASGGSSSYNGRPASPAIAAARGPVPMAPGHRTSYSGGGRPGALVLPCGGSAGGALDSPTLYALRRGDVGSNSGSPAGSQLAHGVPGLGVVDSEQAAAALGHGSAPMSPNAGSFYSRGAPGRTSFSGSASGRFSSGGMTPAANDSMRASHGSLGESMRRSGAGAGGIATMMGGSGGNASMRGSVGGGSIRAGGMRDSNDNLVAAAAAVVAAEAEEEAAAARSLVPRNQAGTFMVREGSASTRPGMRRIAGAF